MSAYEEKLINLFIELTHTVLPVAEVEELEVEELSDVDYVGEMVTDADYILATDAAAFAV